MIIKPGITSEGFRTAVRDYTELTVVEELAANSYDADACTVLVLLDTSKGHLHIIDDGIGFNKESFEQLAVLGAGDKRNIPYSKGKRHYLGSYGYGLKSTLNIATQVRILSISEEGELEATIDWMRLDDSLKSDFPGFPVEMTKRRKKRATGTKITLVLKNPTSKDHLEEFGGVLANLPSDGGEFKCYYGLNSTVAHRLGSIERNFGELKPICRKLERADQVSLAESTLNADLSACEVIDIADKEDKKVGAKFFFAGIRQGKVRSLKPGLRGIYVRIHGRLLKQSFTDRKYTYNISKWVKFENGLRVELSVDWLRDQVSLSREGIRFSNAKLEEDFRSLLTRLVSRFIQPELKKLQQKKEREAAYKDQQRTELGEKRVHGDRSIMVPGLSGGFQFKPETDGELALILAQREILLKINKSFKLIDYNDQAPFDCLIYDTAKRTFIPTELEPTLVEFLEHRDCEGIGQIVTWTRGKWRIGALKKGHGAHFRLVAADHSGRGRYKLLEYRTRTAKTPKRDCPIIVLDELLKC
jgi:hypothetical protein